MRTDLLVLFASHVETRSVTRSAHSLNLSQPAVSHALARLRRAFSDKLFVRSGKGLVLTPQAEELVGPLLSALISVEGLLAGSLDFDPSATSRRFRIASSDYDAMVVVPQFAEPNLGWAC